MTRCHKITPIPVSPMHPIARAVSVAPAAASAYLGPKDIPKRTKTEASTMKHLAIGAGLIATAVFASACNGAETGSAAIAGAGPSGGNSATVSSGGSGVSDGGSSGTGGTRGIGSGTLSGSGVAEPQQTCNADAIPWAIGQPATREVIDRAQRESGAKSVRVLKPGTAVTQEFKYGRLNLNVDASNVIKTVSCW